MNLQREAPPEGSIINIQSHPYTLIRILLDQRDKCTSSILHVIRGAFHVLFEDEASGTLTTTRARISSPIIKLLTIQDDIRNIINREDTLLKRLTSLDENTINQI